MKKKLVIGLFTLGTASMLCGFDSAETAESIIDKSQAASADVSSMSMDMGMNCDVLVNIGDGTTTSSLGLLMTADLDIATTLDPLAMMMDGSIDLSMLGEGQTITMKMYGVTNDAGEFETYVYSEDSATGEGSWVYEAAEGMDLTALAEQTTAVAMSAADMAEWGITFTVAPEAADVDGIECYLVSTSIDSETMTAVYNKAISMLGEDALAGSEADLESLNQAMALLDGLKIDVDYYINTATYEIVKLHMDMNDSDLTMINALLTAALSSTNEDGSVDTSTTTELVLNDLSIDASVSYGSVEPITVPEEALSAVASGEALSASDIASEL